MRASPPPRAACGRRARRAARRRTRRAPARRTSRRSWYAADVDRRPRPHPPLAARTPRRRAPRPPGPLEHSASLRPLVAGRVAVSRRRRHRAAARPRLPAVTLEPVADRQRRDRDGDPPRRSGAVRRAAEGDGRRRCARRRAAPTTVLDVTSLTRAGGEQGLLGLAFSPDGVEAVRALLRAGRRARPWSRSTRSPDGAADPDDPPGRAHGAPTPAEPQRRPARVRARRVPVPRPILLRSQLLIGSTHSPPPLWFRWST